MKQEMRLNIIFISLLGLVLFLAPLAFFEIHSSAFVKRVGALVPCGMLETEYLYLIHHLTAGLPVLFFGVILNLFQYRQVFVEKYLKSTLLLSLVFILWDFFFNQWGIWNFNPEYYCGWTLGGLPFEEWIWFWVIPFCSLFVHEMVKRKIELNLQVDRFLAWTLLVVLIGLYFFNMDRLYSSWSLAASIFVLSISILWRVKGMAVFMVSFLLNLIPMYLFNGMLTGLFTEEALVMYNPLEFSNIRLGTFPIEDLGFGFAYLYGIAISNEFI